jgi:hypothetical protein
MEKTKTKTKTNRITRRKKLKGGRAELIPWEYGGTRITDLPADIIGVIVHTINTIVNAVLVVDNVSELPANMGTAFSSPTEPNPNDIDVTGF